MAVRISKDNSLGGYNTMEVYEALINESNSLKESICTDKEAFLSFMKTVGKFPRYNPTKQLNIHGYADINVTEYAPLDFWHSVGTDIIPSAKPVLVADETNHTVDALYSIKDTDPTQLPNLNYLTWHFNLNDAKDRDYALSVFTDISSGNDISSRIYSEVKKHINFLGNNNKYRDILELGATYAILSRFGLDADKELSTKIKEIDDFNLPFPSSSMYFSMLNKAVREIITPVAKYKRSLKKGVQNNADRRNRGDDGRPVRRNVSVSGEAVRQNENAISSGRTSGGMDETAGDRAGGDGKVSEQRGSGIQQPLERSLSEEHNRESDSSGDFRPAHKETADKSDYNANQGVNQSGYSPDVNSAVSNNEITSEEPQGEDLYKASETEVTFDEKMEQLKSIYESLATDEVSGIIEALHNAPFADNPNKEKAYQVEFYKLLKDYDEILNGGLSKPEPQDFNLNQQYDNARTDGWNLAYIRNRLVYISENINQDYKDLIPASFPKNFMVIDRNLGIDPEFLADRLLYSIRFEHPQIAVPDADNQGFIELPVEAVQNIMRNSTTAASIEVPETANESSLGTEIQETFLEEQAESTIKTELNSLGTEETLEEDLNTVTTEDTIIIESKPAEAAEKQPEEVSLDLDISVSIPKTFEDLKEQLKDYSHDELQEFNRKLWSGKLKTDSKEYTIAIRSGLYLDYIRYNDQFNNGLTDPGYYDGFNLNILRNHILGGVQNIKNLYGEDYSDLIPEPIPNNYMVIDNQANLERTLSRLKRTIFAREKTIFIKGDTPGVFIERDVNEVIAELEIKLEAEKGISSDDTVSVKTESAENQEKIESIQVEPETQLQDLPGEESSLFTDEQLEEHNIEQPLQMESSESDNNIITIQDAPASRIINPDAVNQETEAEKIIAMRESIVDYSTIDYDADMSSVKGKRAVFYRNISAIKLVKFLDDYVLEPNTQELQLLKSYAGFGGIPEAFDSFNSLWKSEYNELISVLSDSEFKSARASALNAHYTPNEIIEAIYKGLEEAGFKGGNILEPSCGSGRFFDAMPGAMRNKSNIFGIELDEITSKIAAKINSDITISNQGFETTTFPDNSFDLAISNIPYGDYRITSDKKYAGQNLFIHDYFLEKMLDQVRPGGYVVALTSKGSLDKKDTRAREYLAKRGSLIAAIRLPENAFNAAGTEAIADIIIIKKNEDGKVNNFKEPGDYLSNLPSLPAWVNTCTIPDNSSNRFHYGFSKENYPKDYYSNKENYTINYYYSENHKNLLGDLAAKSSAFGNVVTLLPSKNNLSVKDRIADIISTIPEADKYKESEELLPVPRQIYSNNDSDQKYGFFVINNELTFYDLSGKSTSLNDLTDKQKDKIISIISIRDSVQDILKNQTLGCSDESLSDLQETLTQLYDTHVKKYGPIFKDRDIKKYFIDDPSYSLIRSLEVLDEENNKVVDKADIFSKRTFIPHTPPTSAGSIDDALKICIQERGKIDFNYMSHLTGRTAPEIISELEDHRIFYNPSTGDYEIAEEYLSGDVRGKIEFIDHKIKELEIKKDHILHNEIYKDYFKPSIPNPPYSQPLEEKICEAFKNRQPLTGVSMSDLDAYYIRNKDKSPNASDIYIMGVCCNSINTSHLFDPSEFKDPLLILKLAKYANDINSRIGVRICSDRDYLKELIFSLPFEWNEKASLFNQVILTEKPQNENEIQKAAEVYSFLEKEVIENYPNMPKNINDDWENFREKTISILQNIENEEVQNIDKEILKLKKNSDALEEVKPPDLLPDEINIQLGATWIKPKIIRDFIIDTLQVPQHLKRDIKVSYSYITTSWHIENASKLNIGVKNDSTFGTEYCSALELIETSLNLRSAEWRTTIIDEKGNERRVIDPEKTMVLRMKQDEIKKAFIEWLKKDTARHQALADYYNRHYNNIRPREYNGQDLIFPEMNPEIKLEKHQKDAIAHTLYGGNTLLAHCVGAGKTFEMIAAIMESKRLGLSHKAMMVVPNHLTEQTGTEFLRLYPNAKILVATKDDFKKDRRKAFFAKIATQNWDAVIIGASQFERMPLSTERLIAIQQNMLNKLIDAEKELGEDRQGNRWSIKQIESKKKKIKAKLDELSTDDIKDEVGFSFEDLGIDKLCVDEAHYYKNLFMVSHMQNVAGINSSNSKRASDLYEKVQYLNEITNNKGVIFATGTPVSNSMTELYTMQRYLQADKLDKNGLSSFDAWAANFGQSVTTMELKPEGKGYQEKTRFSKFFNLPELMNMFKENADIRTADMLPNLKVPDFKLVVERAEASKVQKEIINQLAERAEKIRAGAVSPDKDNMLLITNTGRLAALDPRTLNPLLPDDSGSKINKCVSNILDIYRNTSEKSSTQVVFSDLSTPTNKSKDWNVYDDIKKKLIKGGIPGKEIAFIQDYDTEIKKQKLFDKVKKGEVRVIFGSTNMLGVGTNIQDKLIAAHMVDTLWKPADFEQRVGRIVRRGNENPEVKIFQYITEGTFDAYMWQVMEYKQKFISQIMTSKNPSREAADCDEQVLTFAEIKAIATGNPLIKEKMEVDNELSRISIARSKFFDDKKALRYNINRKYPEEIKWHSDLIANLNEDLATIKNNTPANIIQEDGKSVTPFVIEICGKTYHSKNEATEAFSKVLLSNPESISGTFRGFKFNLKLGFGIGSNRISLKNKSFYDLPLTQSNNLPCNKLEQLAEQIQHHIDTANNKILLYKQNIETAQRELDAPFNLEERYTELTKRSIELTELLEAENKPPEIVQPEKETAEEEVSKEL